MQLEVKNETEMKLLGAKLGRLLRGGEILELVGDVGAGKTTLTKGIASGLGVDEDVQSPSFTISRVYDTPQKIRLAHYDFYRLHDVGIMAGELHETIHDTETVTIIEWAEIVGGVLPRDRLTVHITPLLEEARRVEIKAGGERSELFLKDLL
jgi:tRNA threonylcarbamoyladenosine biosynthesis protein TsaE